MRIAVYPGSFDPLTNGHLDIIKRARMVFDKVVIIVLHNPQKNVLFTFEERVQMIRDIVSDIDGVEVDSFSGLLVDYMTQNNYDIIIKGLRALSDFEYEFQMALMNRKICPAVETLFMMTANDHSYVSSSLVKDVHRHGGDISEFVPSLVEKLLNEKRGG
jgi:pantetheine-phosphate adenylyltransferase